MSAFPDQFPQQPLDMAMPANYDQMVISNSVVLALIMVWIVREARRTRSIIPILFMAGALIAATSEAMWDILGAVWYPQYGPEPLYRAFNVSVPTWMLPAYPCYGGALGYWVYKRFNEGMSQKQFWKFYVAAWLANFLLEIPVLQMQVYAYYGPQPFKLFGFPLYWAACNSLNPIVCAAIAYAWRDFFKGARTWLILAVMPCGQVIALSLVGWPTFVALHGGHDYAATYPAAIISFAISLLAAHMISSKLCRPAATAGTVPAI